jgi:hypothetical protein
MAYYFSLALLDEEDLLSIILDNVIRQWQLPE